MINCIICLMKRKLQSHFPTLNHTFYPSSGLERDAKFSESLEGLRVIQLVRPTVFNIVLPKLLKTPMPLNGIRYGTLVWSNSIRCNVSLINDVASAESDGRGTHMGTYLHVLLIKYSQI